MVISERTHIHSGPQDQFVKFVVVFECQVITDPREAAHLTVTWRRNGEEIDFTNEPRFSMDSTDNSLTISGVQAGDLGLYTCVAENGIDSDEAVAVLNMEGKGLDCCSHRDLIHPF